MQQYYSVSRKNNTLFLNKDDYNHIKNVMRMKSNDKVIVVSDQVSYICSLNNDLTSCEIEEVFKDHDDNSNLIIYVPLLSEEKLSFIFQHCTELGVKEFIIVEYQNCKYKLPKKDYEKKLIRWNKIIKESSEQSYRINKPILEKIINVKNIESIGNVNIMCSLDKNDVKNVCQILTTFNCNDTISLVFGPEGGLCSSEEELLVNKGFIKTSLGDNVLRTETVPIMISSIVKYLKESDKYERH